MKTLEIKAFVPSKDFELSKQFYQDLGFELASDSGGITYFKSCNSNFLLQDFYEERHANNFMMHLLVEDLENFIQNLKIVLLKKSIKYRSPTLQSSRGACMIFVLRIHLEFYGVLLKILTNISKTSMINSFASNGGLLFVPSMEGNASSSDVFSLTPFIQLCFLALLFFCTTSQ